MHLKQELRRPRGIGTLVGVLGAVGGAVAFVTSRMMRRRRPWYERLAHAATHDLRAPSGRQLRRLARR